jgi:putative DNA primase/helicase
MQPEKQNPAAPVGKTGGAAGARTSTNNNWTPSQYQIRARFATGSTRSRDAATADAKSIATVLGLHRSGATFTGNCPCCGYAGAFSVRDVDGRTLFRCHVGCEQGDVLAALRRAGAWGGGASGDCMPFPARPVARGGPEAQRGAADTSEAARRIWQATRPLVGTVGESYLRRSRGLVGIELPADVRFHPSLRHQTGTAWPAMVAGVRDVAGRAVAIHRTYLRPDADGKAPVAPAKMTLGPIGGGAVRLAPAGPHLIVGEGIESTLSAMAGCGLPGWAGLSAGGIRRMVLPASVGTITIAADRDPVGIQAAEDAARRWHAEGRTVRIALPPDPHVDWNNALRATEVPDVAA